MTATSSRWEAPARSLNGTDNSFGRFNLSCNLSKTRRLHRLLPGPALSPGPPLHCLPLLLRPVLLLQPVLRFLHRQCQRTPHLPPQCRPSRPHLLRLLSLPSLHYSSLSETSSTPTERGGSWPSSLDIRCITTSLPTGLLPLPTTPTRAPPCRLTLCTPSLLPSPGPHTCQATASSSGGEDIKTIPDFD